MFEEPSSVFCGGAKPHAYITNHMTRQQRPVLSLLALFIFHLPVIQPSLIKIVLAILAICSHPSQLIPLSGPYTPRMSIPSRQKAVVFGTTGNSDRNGQVKTDYEYPVPTAEKGELLIRNTLCGVNSVDTYYRAGFCTASSPIVLGYEAVGTIVALGPGTRWRNFKVGDRVLWVHKAGYAQYSAVPLDNIIKVPKGVLDHDAIGGFLNGMTALALTKELYKVNKGEWVLLHTTTSNIGLLMVQILKSIGAKVIGTAKGSAHLRIVKSLGADAVIKYADYIESGWVPKVKEITKGEGVSVVYDFVGKDTWKGSLDAVKENGTVLWCGTFSGPVPPIPQK